MSSALGHTHVVKAGAIALCGARVSLVEYLRPLPACPWCVIAVAYAAQSQAHKGRLNNVVPPLRMIPRRPRMCDRG